MHNICELDLLSIGGTTDYQTNKATDHLTLNKTPQEVCAHRSSKNKTCRRRFPSC